MHPIPLCCRQVLPLPTFCGDVGNTIGGISHPTPAHNRGRHVHSYRAPGVNSERQNQEAANRKAPPKTRSPAANTARTTAGDVDLTHRSAPDAGDGSPQHQLPQDYHSGNFIVGTVSLSTAGAPPPAETQRLTWSAPTEELWLQQQHQGQNATTTKKRNVACATNAEKEISKSGMAGTREELCSAEGVDNRGHQREREMNQLPPCDGKRSAASGHRLSPRRAMNSCRTETDRWVLGLRRWVRTWTAFIQ